MSNDSRDRRQPNSAALTDAPADRTTTIFTPMGPEGILQGFYDASADVRGQMLMDRHGGTDGWCNTCQQPASRPAQAAHPFVPMVGRTPGVSQDVDWGRVHNYDPAVDVGQAQTDNGDPAIDSAEDRFRGNSSRQIPFAEGTGPFPG
jgi:hypothetical protein